MKKNTIIQIYAMLIVVYIIKLNSCFSSLNDNSIHDQNNILIVEDKAISLNENPSCNKDIEIEDVCTVEEEEECPEGFTKKDNSITCSRCKRINNCSSCSGYLDYSSDDSCHLARKINKKCDFSFCGSKSGNECKIVRNQRECNCGTNYSGFNCQHKDIDATEYFTNLYNKMPDIISQEKCEFTYEELFVFREISKLVKDKYNDLKETEDFVSFYTKIKSYVDNIDNIENYKNCYSEIIDLLGLFLDISKKRNETDSYKNFIKTTIGYINKAIFFENLDFKSEIDFSISDLSGYINFMRWKTKSSSFSNRYQSIINNLVYIDQNSFLKNKKDFINEYTFIVTEIAINKFDSATSPLIQLSIYSDTNKTYEKNFTINITVPSSYFSGYNESEYQYHIIRDVNIMDKNDNVFNKVCYFNKKYPYDFPKNYRLGEHKLFSRHNISYYDDSANKNDEETISCSNKGYDFELMGFIMECIVTKNTDNVASFIFNINNDSMSSKTYPYDFSLKCLSKIDEIKNNYAFWLYLILNIIFVFIIILFFALRKIFAYLSLQNDLYLYENNILNVKSSQKRIPRNQTGKKQMRVSSEDYSISRSNLSYNLTRKNLLKGFFNNFRELSPIISIFHFSIANPIIVKYFMFVFSTINIFGFSAIYFSQSMLTKRMEDSRNGKDIESFAYPFIRFFGYINGALFTSVGINILAKLFLFLKMKKHKQVIQNILEENSILEKVKVITQFQNNYYTKKRGGYFILCLALEVFMWVYSIGFCGIYVNTQITWFYMGIWGIIWNFVYSTFIIFIISLAEYFECDDKSIYAIKQMFPF